MYYIQKIKQICPIFFKLNQVNLKVISLISHNVLALTPQYDLVQQSFIYYLKTNNSAHVCVIRINTSAK